jgi:hypothetical protein
MMMKVITTTTIIIIIIIIGLIILIRAISYVDFGEGNALIVDFVWVRVEFAADFLTLGSLFEQCV